MSMAVGFYSGVFYAPDSPLYQPSQELPVQGECFAAVGQMGNYRGFLFESTELLADYIFYA